MILIKIGNTFTQDATNASGKLIGVASKATGDLIVTNVGIGYTPSSGQFVFNDVSLTTISGSGRGEILGRHYSREWFYY